MTVDDAIVAAKGKLEPEDHSFWETPGRYHLLIPEGGTEREQEFRQVFDRVWVGRPSPTSGLAHLLCFYDYGRILSPPLALLLGPVGKREPGN
jgi:hypothetical protein